MQNMEFSITRNGRNVLLKSVGIDKVMASRLSDRELILKSVKGINDRKITKNTILNIGNFINTNNIKNVCVVLRNSKTNVVAILTDTAYLVLKGADYDHLKHTKMYDEFVIQDVIDKSCNNEISKKFLSNAINEWYKTSKHIDLYDLIILKADATFSSEDIFITRNE